MGDDYNWGGGIWQDLASRGTQGWDIITRANQRANQYRNPVNVGGSRRSGADNWAGAIGSPTIAMGNVPVRIGGPIPARQQGGSTIAGPKPYRPTLSDFQNSVNAFKSNLDAQNAGDWAGLEAKLAGLYGEAGSQRIAADFTGRANAIDDNLAAQLANSRNVAGGVDDAYYDRAAASARSLFDILNQGADQDEAYTRAQYDFINRALAEARAKTATGRKEGQNVLTANLQDISSQTAAGGSFSSSARDTADQREQSTFQTLMDRLTQADTTAQRDYDESNLSIGKKLSDILNQRGKFKLDLWDAVGNANTGKEKAALDRWNAALRANAEGEGRRLQEQQAQAQLDNFYRGIQQQADNIRWMQGIADYKAREQAFYQAIAAGMAPATQAQTWRPTAANPVAPGHRNLR